MSESGMHVFAINGELLYLSGSRLAVFVSAFVSAQVPTNIHASDEENSHSIAVK